VFSDGSTTHIQLVLQRIMAMSEIDVLAHQLERLTVLHEDPVPSGLHQ
jgi:hypothetical protein